YRRAAWILDDNRCVGEKTSDGERHRDAVIAERIDRTSMESLSSRNKQSIRVFIDHSTKSAQVGRNSENAVALFYAQFTGIANSNALLCAGSEDGDDRNFIDNVRNPSASDVHSENFGTLHDDVADRLASGLSDPLRRDVRSKLLQ